MEWSAPYGRVVAGARGSSTASQGDKSTKSVASGRRSPRPHLGRVQDITRLLLLLPIKLLDLLPIKLL